MLNFNRGLSLLKRYRDDEGGNIALTFAVSTVAIIGSMGAAMDFSTLSNAEARSQSIADQTALSAAIFMKNYDRPPAEGDDGYAPGQYTADEMGYEYKGWVDGGAQNVGVNVVYDDNAKEARVTVTGKTVPTFMQIFGKQSLDFTAESVVSYLQVDETHPASIVMVLDNSGSMRWDDQRISPSGQRPSSPRARIDVLKTSIRTFRSELQSRIGNQTTSEGQVVLRTGILPYNSEIVALTSAQAATEGSRKMKWGFLGIGDAFINPMQAQGSTNSNPPMAKARVWLGQEDEEHRKEANRVSEEYRQPLKFVVFMTDGQNTSGDLEFVANDTTNRFYAFKPLFGRPAQWWVSRNRPFDSDFLEGNLELNSDRVTVESCRAMQAEGTEIFTIGYGLEVGHYYDPLNPDEPQPVSERTQATAYALLSSCASKPENFIEAGSGTELEGAFDQIQNAIVKELIRIKS